MEREDYIMEKYITTIIYPFKTIEILTIAEDRKLHRHNISHSHPTGIVHKEYLWCKVEKYRLKVFLDNILGE